MNRLLLHVHAHAHVHGHIHLYPFAYVYYPYAHLLTRMMMINSTMMVHTQFYDCQGFGRLHCHWIAQIHCLI